MKSDFYEEYFHHENTHWWFRWRFDLIGDVVGSLTRGKSDVKILDAGCGTGQMTKLLEGYGDAVAMFRRGEGRKLQIRPGSGTPVELGGS